MNLPDTELDDLLAGLCDDTLSEEDLRRLADKLRTDPAARTRYHEWVELHAELALAREDTLALAITHAVTRQPSELKPERPTSPLRQFWFRWTGYVLAASLLLGVLIFRLQQHPPVSTAAPEALAVVVEAEAALWEQPGLPTVPGANLPAGPMTLRAGRVLVRMNCGAELVLVAPVDLELLDAKQVHLRSGQLNSRVPNSGIGFRVTTPHMDVVDLGTEFAVSVEAGQASEVHVVEGIVVARSLGSSGVVPLHRREAGRVDATVAEMVQVPFDGNRFGSAGAATRQAAKDDRPPVPADARLVFLGDQVVDQQASLHLLSQALGPVGAAKPRLYNAGIAFPLNFKEPDYTQHIARFKPTHAVLVFGPELAVLTDHYLLPPERFQQWILRLVDRLVRDGIEPVLATGYALAPQHTDAQRRLNEYNQFLRGLATKRGYRLADVEGAFRAVPREQLLVPNGWLPNFAGHRQVARALLDSLGHPNATVPDTLKLQLLPGVIQDWRVLPTKRDQPLEPESVVALRPDASWWQITVPQPVDPFSARMADPTESSVCRERLLGGVNGLKITPTQHVIAVATFESSVARKAVLNVGGAVSAVWLNGTRVAAIAGWHGHHPGHHRLEVDLLAGKNEIVLESRYSFFLSVTDTFDWTLP